MGSFFFGGSVKRDEKTGLTFHGDHGYAQFYIPTRPRTLPIIMWHGSGQSGRCFESTPDGREGFQTILPRNDWAVYIIDQPRRGRAGRTMSPPPPYWAPIPSNYEIFAWNANRLGHWTLGSPPTLRPNLQMPADAWTIDQFMRQMTPDTGERLNIADYDSFMANAMKALLEQTGPAILITHSYSGRFGWATAAAAPELVRAIVAFEPGLHMFPKNEAPPEISSPNERVPRDLAPMLAPPDRFKKLTTMPILLVYGDNIATEPGMDYTEETWRFSLARAREFVAAVNRHGGDATLIHLPELGIRGNTHALFADLNNVEIARLMEQWLAEKGLDGRDRPHPGPKKPDMELTIPYVKALE